MLLVDAIVVAPRPNPAAYPRQVRADGTSPALDRGGLGDQPRPEQPSNQLAAPAEAPLLGRSYFLVREFGLDLLQHPRQREARAGLLLSQQSSKAGQSSPYRRSSERAGRAQGEGAAKVAGFGMASEYEDRKRLTFEQAEGAEPLPSQLKLKEVSPELRARLWAIFYQELSNARDPYEIETYATLGGTLVGLLCDWHVTRRFRPADEFRPRYDDWVAELKSLFMEGDYLEIFGFVQWVLRHGDKPYELEIEVRDALQISRAAYAIFDGDTIIPIGSDVERETLARAFADVAASEFHGARAHLRSAGSELTAGKYGPSIRESIHAVEAVARVLEPSARALAPALAKLERSVHVHHNLHVGFCQLYNFTSVEKGIRHALLDEPVAQVDETDALYMLGSCAAFISYLINKARHAGLL